MKYHLHINSKVFFLILFCIFAIFFISPKPSQTEDEQFLQEDFLIQGQGQCILQDVNEPEIFTIERGGKVITAQVLNIPYGRTVNRVSAILAFWLLALSLITGAMPRELLDKFIKVGAIRFHIWTGALGFGLTILHIFSLLYDPTKWSYLGFTGALTPSFDGEISSYIAWGIIAFYLLVLTVLTSVIYRDVRTKIWHVIHLLNYPLFFISAWHGLKLGPDNTGFILYASVILTGTVLLASLWRLWLVILGKINKI